MSDADSPTAVLAVLATEFEATLLVDALQDRGITAEAAGGLTAGFRAEAPGTVRVLVLEGDLERARAAMNEFRQEQSEIDWSSVDVGDFDPDAE